MSRDFTRSTCQLCRMRTSASTRFHHRLPEHTAHSISSGDLRGLAVNLHVVIDWDLGVFKGLYILEAHYTQVMDKPRPSLLESVSTQVDLAPISRTLFVQCGLNQAMKLVSFTPTTLRRFSMCRRMVTVLLAQLLTQSAVSHTHTTHRRGDWTPLCIPHRCTRRRQRQC